jgi:hypothetical protein
MMSSSSSSTLVTVLGLLLLVLCQTSAEIIPLTDTTFEHQTQASTGMTTGSWLVYFHVPACTSCEILKPILQKLSTEEALVERGIVVASVDCSESSGVCQRFSIDNLPSMMYLHKKQLYNVPPAATTKPREEETTEEVPSTFEILKSFVLEPPIDDARTIPEPPSLMDTLIKEPLGRLYEEGRKSPLLGVAILTMSSMLFLTVLVLVYALVSGKVSSTTPKPVKKKSKKN